MLADVGSVFFLQRFGKVMEKVFLQVIIVRQAGREDLLVKPYFSISEQNSHFRPRQAFAQALALGNRRCSCGRNSTSRLSSPAFSSMLHAAHMLAAESPPRALRKSTATGSGGNCLRSTKPRDIVRHAAQQLVARVNRQIASIDNLAQQDLDVDFVIGRIDAGGIIDRIGIDAAALERIFDAAALGHAEIGALADDFGAHIAGIDAQGFAGAVADFLMRFVAGLDKGADAAEI